MNFINLNLTIPRETIIGGQAYYELQEYGGKYVTMDFNTIHPNISPDMYSEEEDYNDTTFSYLEYLIENRFNMGDILIMDESKWTFNDDIIMNEILDIIRNVDSDKGDYIYEIINRLGNMETISIKITTSGNNLRRELDECLHSNLKTLKMIDNNSLNPYDYIETIIRADNVETRKEILDDLLDLATTSRYVDLNTVEEVKSVEFVNKLMAIFKSCKVIRYLGNQLLYELSPEEYDFSLMENNIDKRNRLRETRYAQAIVAAISDQFQDYGDKDNVINDVNNLTILMDTILSYIEDDNYL